MLQNKLEIAKKESIRPHVLHNLTLAGARGGDGTAEQRFKCFQSQGAFHQKRDATRDVVIGDMFFFLNTFQGVWKNICIFTTKWN